MGLACACDPAPRPLASQAEARRFSGEVAKAPEDPATLATLAEHAEQQVRELADAVKVVRSQTRRDALVGPIAVTAWPVGAREAEPKRARVSDLKKAEAWMKEAERRFGRSGLRRSS